MSYLSMITKLCQRTLSRLWCALFVDFDCGKPPLIFLFVEPFLSKPADGIPIALAGKQPSGDINLFDEAKAFGIQMECAGERYCFCSGCRCCFLFEMRYMVFRFCGFLLYPALVDARLRRRIPRLPHHRKQRLGKCPMVVLPNTTCPVNEIAGCIIQSGIGKEGCSILQQTDIHSFMRLAKQGLTEKSQLHLTIRCCFRQQFPYPELVRFLAHKRQQQRQELPRQRYIFAR